MKNWFKMAILFIYITWWAPDSAIEQWIKEHNYSYFSALLSISLWMYPEMLLSWLFFIFPFQVKKNCSLIVFIFWKNNTTWTLQGCFYYDDVEIKLPHSNKLNFQENETVSKISF